MWNLVLGFGEAPNDHKLSDGGGLAGRVPPGETQEELPELANAPDEEARDMTDRSRSLQRMVRRFAVGFIGFD